MPLASYKDDDFFQFCHGVENARYRYFNDSVSAIREFKDILDARLGGDSDRSFRLLWIDELAAMVTGLPKAEATLVKDAVSTTLQTGRSINCQLLVSVQRADSVYFNNGSKENFRNIVFLDYIVKINRISDVRPGTPNTPVTVKRCGNITEIKYAVHGPPAITIEKLNTDLYVDKRTGEVKEFQHKNSRAEDQSSVAQSLRKLRDLINANLEDPETALWVTLTYRENMRDPARLYEDYRRFWQRFKYYLRKHGYPPAEYIIAAEPQGRGAWHLHCIFLLWNKFPYIPNTDMARLWGHGFTKTKSLKHISNPGLYLTAYLGDMELSEAIGVGQYKAGRLVESKDKRKAVIKGARLRLYPPGFNLYRFSRGVKRPEVRQTTEGEAQAEISGMALTYEKTISVSDESGTVRNIINYRTYTKASAESDNKETSKEETKTEEE